MAGLEFFEGVRELQGKVFSDVAVENSLQTNGVLLDGPWVRFFLDAAFHVGVSVDGPRHIHDDNRVFSNGRGSFVTVVKNVARAREMGLSLGVICVPTKISLGREAEIYDFFKELG